MRAFYSDHLPLPLPDGHRFPLQKYARLSERILAGQILLEANLSVPEPAADEQLLRVHSVRIAARYSIHSLESLYGS